MFITGSRGFLLNKHTKNIDVSKILDELTKLLNTFPYNQPWVLKK